MSGHVQGLHYGRQIMEEVRTVFLTIANVWNLLIIFRAAGSGYAVQLHGDITFKASKAALNKLGSGIKMLGTWKPLCTGHSQSDSSRGIEWGVYSSLDCNQGSSKVDYESSLVWRTTARHTRASNIQEFNKTSNVAVCITPNNCRMEAAWRRDSYCISRSRRGKWPQLSY